MQNCSPQQLEDQVKDVSDLIFVVVLSAWATVLRNTVFACSEGRN